MEFTTIDPSQQLLENLPCYLTGSTSGLSLILNVEQYEYMRGPQNDAGVKVNTKTV